MRPLPTLLLALLPILALGQSDSWQNLRYQLQQATIHDDLARAQVILDSLDANRPIGDRTAACEYFFTQAIFLESMGEVAQAEEAYSKALNEAGEYPECAVCKAKAMINRANFLNALERPIYSPVDDLKQAYLLCSENGDNCMYNALLGLGQWYYYKGSMDTSLHWLTVLLNLARAERNEDWMGEALYNRALPNHYLGNQEACLQDCREALPLLDEYSPGTLPYLHVTMGSSYRIQGVVDSAIIHLLLADSLLSMKHDKELLVDTWSELSSCYAQLGDTVNELRYSRYAFHLERNMEYEKDSLQQILLNRQQGRWTNSVNQANADAVSAEQEKQKAIGYSVAGISVLVVLAMFLIHRVRKQRQLRAQEREEALGRLKKTQEKLTQEKVLAQLEARRKERDRIARDLHDSLGGQIAAVKMQSEILKMSDDPAVVRNMMEQLDKLAQEVRSISHDLNSSLIEELGLLGALDDFRIQISRTGKVKMELEVLCDDCSLGEERESHLYRMIVEAINNSIRHGNATRVVVEISKGDDGNFLFVVSDNGSGFDTRAEFDGMGLRTLRYRGDQIGARVEVSSDPGTGTSVLIHLTQHSPAE